MSSTSTVQQYRVRVFVDFWNYTLAMKQVDAGFRTDWSALGPKVARAAALTVGPTVQHAFQGMSVHGSYNPSSDKKLKDWVTNKLNGYPGVSVSFTERHKKRHPPSCPHCYSSVPICPGCGRSMLRTEEKGVDVRLTVEMISLAMLRSYDIAVLISSDRDFIPVAEYLDSHGIIVIHGAFGNKSAELTRSCWSKIDLPGLRNNFRL